jgi:hypothetical protein
VGRVWGGRRTSALGVVSVWMNIVRRAIVADGVARWGQRWNLGRCCVGDGVMGEALWWRHLVAIRGAFVRKDDVFCERMRMVARDTEFVVMVSMGFGCEIACKAVGCGGLAEK